jgi:hypothetical protein
MPGVGMAGFSLFRARRVGGLAKMLSFAPAHLQPTIEIFEHRQGPFTEGHSRIKHVYVASPITYDEQPR